MAASHADAARAKLVSRLIALALLLVSAVGCQLVAGDFDIAKVKGAQEGVCKAGEFRCNGAFLLSCTSDGNDWMLNETCATDDLCDSKLEKCRICDIGDLRCNGAQRQECNIDGTSWEDVGDACISEGMCNPSFCGNCTPGEYSCRGTDDKAGLELWKCGDDGTWSNHVEDCATAGVCDASIDMWRTDPNWSGMCVDAACSTPGEYACDGQELRRCRQDQTGWDTIDTCESVELCQQGVANAVASQGLVDMCPFGCLSAGMFVCNGQALTRCNEALTGYDFVMQCEEGTDCNPVQGACSPPCTPGEFQCNGSDLRHCKDDHSWEVLQTCASPVLCITTLEGEIATSGVCLDPACETPGEFMCDGAALYECRRDLSSWDTAATCYSGDLCSAADKRCNDPACQPDEYRCFDNELRHCNVSLTGWDVVQTCTEGQFCSNDPADPGCKLECPSTTRCNGAELERCTPNGWVHQATCPTTDLCSCTLTDTCQLGLWTDGCGTAVCGGTLAGYQCAGSTLQKCQEGRNGWDTMSDCGSAALCYPGAAPMFTQGYCATCPTAGEVRCAPSGSPVSTQTCSADRKTWNTTQSCSSTYGCVDSGSMDYCAICNTGQVQCSAATLQRCGAERRSWVETACMSAALCDQPGNQCDICTPNTNWCVGKVLHHCSTDGQQDQTQTCANLCDPVGGECDACVPNTSRCANTTLYTCSANGQTEAPMTCATAALCNATGQKCDAPTCAVNETRCVGTQPQICNTNRNGWDLRGTACATAALCVGTTGTCTAPTCAVGETRCTSAGQPQICNANRNGWDNLGSACATAALCVGTTGTCTMPFCAPNQTRCNGAQPEVCKADRTGFQAMGTLCASANLCNAATGTCSPPVCASNETRCTGAQPEICKGDRTGFQNAGTPCATAALCNPGSASCTPPACAVGEKRCTGAQPEICNADRTGFQSDGAACATAALCNQTTFSCIAPACTPGQTRCSGAQPQICNANQNGWNPMGSACATAALCNTNGTCSAASCNPGDTRCNGAQPEACNANQNGWSQMGNPCVTAALCNQSTGTCTNPTCNPMQRRCTSGGQPQICNANQNGWDDSGMPCATAALCMGGMCTAPTCNVNEKQCSGAQPQICNDDRNGWDNNGAVCANAGLCNGGVCTPPTCMPMQHQCVGTSLQVCKDDLKGYREIEVCGSDALCASGMSMGACTPPACAANQWHCSGANLQQCRADLTAYMTMQTCASAALCDEANMECDDCMPPAFQCVSPNTLQSCTAQGHWMDQMVCAVDTTCDAQAQDCVPSGGTGSGSGNGTDGTGGTSGGSNGSGGAGGG